jgi:hypothetical protein
MKSIPGYEGLYSAEEDGRIYSHIKDKYFSPDISNNGYYRVTLSKDDSKIRYSVHRLIALTYIENPDNKPIIDHIDRIKTNNSVNNLRWATIQENCANTIVYKNNKLGHKHIRYVIKDKLFRISITRNGINHSKCFKTLDEAIAYRDNYLAQLL